MNGDMGGAAAILALMRFVAEQKIPLNISAVIPAVENMTGSEAYTASSVIGSYANGPTVQVIHTDAEGRLIMADSLRYLSEKYSPDKIIEFSTLTGATLKLTGGVRAVVAYNNSSFDEIIDIGEIVGDKLQKLEIDVEHHDLMVSDVADYRNLSENHEQMGIQTSYAFLEGMLNFNKDKRIPYMHIDIAGDAKESRGSGINAIANYLINTFVKQN